MENLVKISPNFKFEEINDAVIVLDIKNGAFFEMDLFSYRLLQLLNNSSKIEVEKSLKDKYVNFNQDEFDSFYNDLCSKEIILLADDNE